MKGKKKIQPRKFSALFLAHLTGRIRFVINGLSGLALSFSKWFNLLFSARALKS